MGTAQLVERPARRKINYTRLSAVIGIVLAFVFSAVALFQPRLTGAEYREIESKLKYLEHSVQSLEQDLKREWITRQMSERATLVPWLVSEDHKLRARLVAIHDETEPMQDTWLMLELQNATDQPLVLDSPIFTPWGISLAVNGEPTRYNGLTPLFATSPAKLGPRATQRELLELTSQQFPDISTKTGEFVVEYLYVSDPKDPIMWRGKVGPLTAKWTSDWQPGSPHLKRPK
jgi:hypothetical protein